MLGLSASVYLLAKQHWRHAEVPRIILLPVMLMLLVLVQYLFDKTTYFGQTLLYTLYMLWVVLLIILGRALREELGMAVLGTVLASFLLLGTELNALLGILQHYRWHTFLDTVVTAKIGIAVYGNMAQPNHYANYIVMGLASLGLLQPRLRIWQLVLLAAPLLFVMVLSGSRSSWIYLLSMAAMAYLWQRRDPTSKPLFVYTLILVAGFGLMHWVVQLPGLSGYSGNITAMQRLMASDGSGSVRVYLWQEAWLIFTQFPFLGAGIGQYAWQHFQLAPVLHTPFIGGLYNNAHNLLMHIAAEMGLAGLLIVIGTLVMWGWMSWRSQKTVYHWWAYTVLLVLGIHSMLEYPLWYAYFLGIAAVLLGVLESATYKLELQRLGRVSILAVLVLGFVTLIQYQQGYARLERALTSRPLSQEDKTAPRRYREGLIKVYSYPLLQPYAELFMNNFIDATPDEIDKKLAMNERAMKFVPISSVVYRRALLLSLAGKQEEASVQMERAIWAYPADFPAHSKELTELAQKDPARFSALLEFAIEKNKEYQRAVSTK